MPSVKLLFKEAKSQTSLTDEYQINATQEDITINLIPGDIGQASISLVKLENTVLADEHLGSLDDFVIGSNISVANKFLSIITIITDVSQNSNGTSIDFSIQGGVRPFSTKMVKLVTSQGDSVGYKIEIFFFE
jgi:hypothetical protein